MVFSHVCRVGKDFLFNIEYYCNTNEFNKQRNTNNEKSITYFLEMLTHPVVYIDFYGRVWFVFSQDNWDA